MNFGRFFSRLTARVKGVFSRSPKGVAASSRRTELALARQNFAAQALATVTKTAVEKRLERWTGPEVAPPVDSCFEFGDGEIAHTSPILNEFSAPGDHVGDLYDRQMVRDLTSRGLWAKRVQAITCLDWRVKPAADTAKALEAAKFCRQFLDSIDIGAFIEDQLEHRLYGVAFSEPIYTRHTFGPLAGRTVPCEFVRRPMRRFAFKKASRRGHPRRFDLFVRTGLGTLRKVPPMRVLTCRLRGSDSPWGGVNLSDEIYWPNILEVGGWKAFAIGMERWGMPIGVAKYKARPDNAGKDKDAVAWNQQQEEELLDILSLMQTDQGFVIPDSVDLTTFEAKRGGSVNYAGFIQLIQRIKTLRFMGELDTSGVAQSAGSFAKAKVSNRVRMETVKADALAIARHVTLDLLWPLVIYNLGTDYPPPLFTLDVLQAEDKQLLREGVMGVLNAGQAVGRQWFFDVHSCPIPEPGEETIELPAGALGAGLLQGVPADE